MPALAPFTPGATSTLPVTTANASVALSTKARDQVMVTNAPGGSIAFIAFGDSTVTATVAASTPVLPGVALMFTINPLQTHIAAITGAGTATIYATVGQGG